MVRNWWLRCIGKAMSKWLNDFGRDPTFEVPCFGCKDLTPKNILVIQISTKDGLKQNGRWDVIEISLVWMVEPLKEMVMSRKD